MSAALFLLCGIILIAVRSEAPASPSHVVSAQSGCTVEEVSRRPARLADGRAVYVEPSVFVSTHDGASALLAGTPNYVWTDDGKSKSKGTRNSIFGAVISRTGAARAIQAPINSEYVLGVQAIRHPMGGWWVAFAETTDPVARPDSFDIQTLHVGIFDGREWRMFDSFELPDSVRVRPELSSLTAFDDTIVWAVFEERRLGTSDRGILVFQFVDGHWSFERLPAVVPAYVELIHTESRGLLAAVVEADSSLPYDANSLFLYSRNPDWHRLRKVLNGTSWSSDQSLSPQRLPVHHPQLTVVAESQVLTWRVNTAGGEEQRYQAKAMFGTDLVKRNGSALSIDSHIANSGGGGVVFTSVAGTRLWLTDHIISASNGKRELRFSTDCRLSGICMIGRIVPYPFDGGFAVTALSPSELVIAGAWGPWHATDSKIAPLVTGLINLRFACNSDS